MVLLRAVDEKAVALQRSGGSPSSPVDRQEACSIGAGTPCARGLDLSGVRDHGVG